jgi:hypothetical protein
LQCCCGSIFIISSNPWWFVSYFGWKHGLHAMDPEERGLLSWCVWCCTWTPQHGGQFIDPTILGFLEWFQQLFLESIAYEDIGFFDFSIGLWVCNGREVKLDAQSFYNNPRTPWTWSLCRCPW